MITVIIGPTAIGKSDFAIELAHKQNAQIISADAFQVYRHFDIGTGKVSLDQRNDIEHHLIDIKDPHEVYNVAEFIQQTESIIQTCQNTDTPVIICGGTGLYIRAFLYQFTFPLAKSSLNYPHENATIPSEKLWDTLNQVDSVSAKSVHPNNHVRIQRLLDVYNQTGTPPSEQQQAPPKMRDGVRVIGLTAPREQVIDRINRRFDHMIKDGFVDEVRRILEMGVPLNANAFKAIGYREIAMYLNGDKQLDEMIHLSKVKTRQFSKRQMTWFRQLNHVEWKEINF